jgi:catechol 2,3-dioxygenase-like lactoylglutathione lyase family enzyme
VKEDDMTVGVLAIDHVNITVPRAVEEQAKAFYGGLLGLPQVPKADPSRGGAWYLLGDLGLHLSIEDAAAGDRPSSRHVCVRVADLARAEAVLRGAGVAILPDERPAPGWRRFYVRDPGGNRVEVGMSVADL